MKTKGNTDSASTPERVETLCIQGVGTCEIHFHVYIIRRGYKSWSYLMQEFQSADEGKDDDLSSSRKKYLSKTPSGQATVDDKVWTIKCGSKARATHRATTDAFVRLLGSACLRAVEFAHSIQSI
jgi:hypothetical protein